MLLSRTHQNPHIASKQITAIICTGMLSPSQPYFDSHVQVAEFAQVLIGNLAGVGPISSAQQPMLIQLLADLSFHLWVLRDQVKQPGSTVPCSLKAGQEDADL